MTSRARVAVSGYYGCGNAGDEAVLAGIIESFRIKSGGDGTEIVALSQNPDETKRLHGIEAAYRMSPAVVRETLKKCDLLISGGGSLLQDATSFKSLVYYLWVVRVARRMKLPVMFYAQGMGPFRRPASKLLVRLVANSVQSITVRDDASRVLLKEIGVNRPPIEVTADPAFALPLSDPIASQELWRRHGLPVGERPNIGVALRPWGGESTESAAKFAQLLLEIEAQTGGQVILVPMQIPGDLNFSLEVAKLTGRPDSFPILGQTAHPAELLDLVSRMDAVVAMRLHALIFAARAAVPAFALAYDPKVDSLMKLLNLKDRQAHWRDFDPAEVSSKVKFMLNESESRARLALLADELKEKALRNAEIALKIMGR